MKYGEEKEGNYLEMEGELELLFFILEISRKNYGESAFFFLLCYGFRAGMICGLESNRITKKINKI